MCLLAALSAVRNIPMTRLAAVDVVALWEDLGPVLDKLEDGEYSVEDTHA